MEHALDDLFRDGGGASFLRMNVICYFLIGLITSHHTVTYILIFCCGYVIFHHLKCCRIFSVGNFGAEECCWAWQVRTCLPEEGIFEPSLNNQREQSCLSAMHSLPGVKARRCTLPLAEHIPACVPASWKWPSGAERWPGDREASRWTERDCPWGFWTTPVCVPGAGRGFQKELHELISHCLVSSFLPTSFFQPSASHWWLTLPSFLPSFHTFTKHTIRHHPCV